jgi:hypothetical protein
MNDLQLNRYGLGVCQEIKKHRDWRYYLTVVYRKPISLDKSWKLTKKYLMRIVKKNEQVLFVKAEGRGYSGPEQQDYHFHILISDSGIRYDDLDAIRSKLTEITVPEALKMNYQISKPDQVEFDIQDIYGDYGLTSYVTKIQNAEIRPDHKDFLGERGFRYWMSPGYKKTWGEIENQNSFNDLSSLSSDH